MNRHLNSYVIAEQTEQQKLDEVQEQEKKVYSMQLMLSLRLDNKTRPVNMALLDFPHKKRKA